MIDLIASEPQYYAHLGPLWVALPEEARGIRIGRRGSEMVVPARDLIRTHRRQGQRPDAAVLVASAGDLGRARRFGYRRIAYLEHGIGQSYANGNPAYPGGRGRDAVSLFLSPNGTAAGMDRAAYPRARVEVIGDPRLDTLPKREPGPQTVCISFHWPASSWKPWDLSAFRHYRHALRDLAQAVPLIGHAHPRAARTLEPVYRRLGIEFVPSFDDVCRRADVYVADNTSTLYEFASTGRPVVVLNAPHYRRDLELGLRFWAASKVGWNVEAPEDLIHTVVMADATANAEPVVAHREHALSVAYGYRSGAAERGTAAITDWLAEIGPKSVSYSVAAA